VTVHRNKSNARTPLILVNNFPVLLRQRINFFKGFSSIFFIQLVGEQFAFKLDILLLRAYETTDRLARINYYSIITSNPRV